MRKSSLTLLAVAIGLAASQAVAADLPRKAPPAALPPPPPPLTWTGCYIGANIGGVDRRLEANFDFGSIDQTRRFGLYRWRSDWLRLSIRWRLGDRLPQYV